MSDIDAKLSTLKNSLETAAFLVSKGGAKQEAHTEIVKSLVILSSIEASMFHPGMAADSKKAEDGEATKVCRRLKLWAKRQNQINSKILNSYLTLERSGLRIITESDLKNALPQEASFDSNFVQMKIIAEKNHGKIFVQYGENVTLWSPVVSYVREYENIVFNSKSENDRANMAKYEFNGGLYNDDRLFVMSVCKCTVSERDGCITTTLKYRNAPINHSWCVATFRNTPHYEAFRVDSFQSERAAWEHLGRIEPTTPLISLGGKGPTPPLPHADFIKWKEINGLQDYDYKRMFTPDAQNPEVVFYQQVHET